MNIQRAVRRVPNRVMDCSLLMHWLNLRNGSGNLQVWGFWGGSGGLSTACHCRGSHSIPGYPMCVGRRPSGPETDSFPNTSVLPCHYHFANIAYSCVILQQTLYNLSNWERLWIKRFPSMFVASKRLAEPLHRKLFWSTSTHHQYYLSLSFM
jgi:hypothetical protein